MAVDKEYRILVVERDGDARERIASTLAMADLSSSVAEEKSVARAITHLLNADLNVLIAGPSLDVEEIKKLNSAPSSFGKRVTICFDEDIAEQINCKSTLRLPFLPEDGRLAILSAFNKKAQIQVPKDDEPRVSEAMQLAFVVSRLADRLLRVQEVLKKQPKELKLQSTSIPEAVNTVIAGASKIRQGQEQEDIKALIDTLFK